jgi:nucleoid-associated protein YgaU
MDAEAAKRTTSSAALAMGALLLCAGGLRLCWMAAAGPLEAIQASGPEAPDGLIVVGAAALGAVVLAWLGLGAILAALAAAPGAVGRLAGGAAARVAPAAVRRATALLLGTALATAVTPLAHAAGPQARPSPGTATSQTVRPAPDPGFGVTMRQPVGDGEAADAGGSVPPTMTLTAPDPRFGAEMPASAPELGPLGPATHTPSSTALGTVTVVRGDTLWAIAARHLSPGASPLQVAREWPRWYAVNRAVIGSDPNVIHVGQVLTVPSPGESS